MPFDRQRAAPIDQNHPTSDGDNKHRVVDDDVPCSTCVIEHASQAAQACEGGTLEICIVAHGWLHQAVSGGGQAETCELLGDPRGGNSADECIFVQIRWHLRPQSLELPEQVPGLQAAGLLGLKDPTGQLVHGHHLLHQAPLIRKQLLDLVRHWGPNPEIAQLRLQPLRLFTVGRPCQSSLCFFDIHGLNDLPPKVRDVWHPARHPDLVRWSPQDDPATCPLLEQAQELLITAD
mmetsp:Transcript_53712/g.140710  ORF Transcript_53712/g.140710 Transcript_53712/m.140710 type:complete len:234 (+) Transcript_53712:531-1232(+)